MKCLFTIPLFCIVHLAVAQVTQSKITLPDSVGVTEKVFGKTIEDPFRGLEQVDSPIVQTWMKRKNEEAIQSLQQIAGYEELKQEIIAYRNSSNIRSSVPIENNGTIYSLRTLMDSETYQIVSYESPSAEVTVLFSTAALNQRDGTFYTIYSFEPSPDNRYIAIQMYPDGNDVMEIRILDVAQQQLLDEVIDTSISYFPSWLPDSKSFFYTQLSVPEDSVDYFDKVRVKLHFMGKSQSEDKVMLEPGDYSSIEYQPGDFPVFQVLTGGKYALCSVARGISQYLHYYLIPLSEFDQSTDKRSWITVFTMNDQVSDAVSDGHNLYSLNHRKNFSGSIYKTALDKPDSSFLVFAPEGGYINALKATQEALYVEHIVDGLSHIIQIKGDSRQELMLPFSGDVDLSTDGFLLSGSGRGMFFGLANWNHGYGIYYYHPEKDTVIITGIRPAGTYDLPTDLVVEEVLVTSHDGEKVPLSIIHNKQVQHDGTNPTIIEAYGAYGESLESYFSVEMLAWYQRGGILAYAHVRGGREKGIAWHNSGKKENKPNTWKDLIACTEYMIENKYTTPERLGARGGSAGGIAIGRAMTERPELFGAAVLEFPVVNPTRLDQTPNAIVQEDEFGSPNDSSEFQHLYNMDTYLHVREGKNYPAVLLIAGREDDRVPYWEPAKLAARMARDRGNDQVTLLRLYEGGHGTGGIDETVGYSVDPIAFFLWQLEFSKNKTQP